MTQRKLRQHVRKVDYCNRLLEDSRAEALAAKGFAKKILRAGSAFSVSGAVMYKQNIIGGSIVTDDDGLVVKRVS